MLDTLYLWSLKKWIRLLLNAILEFKHFAAILSDVRIFMTIWQIISTNWYQWLIYTLKKKEYFITVWYAKRCNKCSNSASLSQRLRYKKTTTTTQNNVTVQMSLTFARVVTDYIFLYLIFSLWWWIPCFSSLIMEKTTHNFLKILTVSCQGLGEKKKGSDVLNYLRTLFTQSLSSQSKIVIKFSFYTRTF